MGRYHFYRVDEYFGENGNTNVMLEGDGYRVDIEFGKSPDTSFVHYSDGTGRKVIEDYKDILSSLEDSADDIIATAENDGENFQWGMFYEDFCDSFNKLFPEEELSNKNEHSHKTERDEI